MTEDSKSPGWVVKGGFWMQAKSGRRVDLWNVTPDQIDIEDIAWGLTGVMRFTGAGKRNVSVAEHSMRVHAMVEGAGGTPAANVWALMHDGHEAYIGDISTPTKRTIQQIAGQDIIGIIEERLDAAITKRLGLPRMTDDDRKLVKLADHWSMAFEKTRLLEPNPEWSFDLSQSPFDNPDVDLKYDYSREDLAADFVWAFNDAMRKVARHQLVMAAIAPVLQAAE